MIRLGSLAGYPFEGPRVLAGWNAPPRPGVFAIMMRAEPVKKPNEFAVIYVGASEDLSREGFPFKHRHAPCWVKRSGDRYGLHICVYEVPGGLPTHRIQIAKELIAVYQPGCNPEQYDQAWESHWIGDYDTPGTTKPLTTPREAS